MKFLIAGAGAVGGYIGACLARAAYDVTGLARGPHRRAMEERGLRIIRGDGDFEVHAGVIGNIAEAGPMDVIFLGVKAHGLTQLAPQVTPLIGENTTVVSTQNGIPWWYFQSHAGEHTGLHLERVDPGGVIAAAIPAARVAASIAYFATEIAEPGGIRHIEGNPLSLGEPHATPSNRCNPIPSPPLQSYIP